MTNEELQEENKRLEEWIDDLQSGMWINCVYCGHRYGPNSGPNTKDFNLTMRKALEQHISECPKHPLSKATAEIASLRAANRELVEALERIADKCSADGFEDYEPVNIEIGMCAKEAIKQSGGQHDG